MMMIMTEIITAVGLTTEEDAKVTKWLVDADSIPDFNQNWK